jgi:hypothetical protein
MRVETYLHIAQVAALLHVLVMYRRSASGVGGVLSPMKSPKREKLARKMAAAGEAAAGGELGKKDIQSQRSPSSLLPHVFDATLSNVRFLYMCLRAQ